MRWMILALTVSGCARDCPRIEIPDKVDRLGSIPPGAEKRHSGEGVDPGHPVLHATDRYCPAEPMEGPVNTAGAEDSAFWDPDGETFSFFFTPDASLGAEEQVGDGVTGIWQTRRTASGWTEPHKLWLFEVDSLEGCAVTDGKTIRYCAAVCGEDGVALYHSDFRDGAWTPGEQIEAWADPRLSVGEFHLSADGDTVVYHSDQLDGEGGLDLYMSTKQNGRWGDPVNLGPAINGPDDDGFPALANGDTELWFNSASRKDANGDGLPDYFGGIFVSQKEGDGWGEPEEIVSQLAGEASVGPDGSVYFTHHFFDGDVIEDADIYVIRRIPTGEDPSWCEG